MRSVRAAASAAALVVAAAAAAVAVAAAPAAAAASTVAIDGGIVGRTFDGVGALSAGGNSRLLMDYPEPQRSQILDYLFKPGYGAAIQLLKLEVGGDGNSTDGSEASHEHVRGEVNCNAGFEFWLGEQAIARNPNIRIVGLPWTAPGWIGAGNFWSADMIDYDIAWLNCAKSHGIGVAYLGGWNERGHDSGWYKNLRTGLDRAGYGGVQIVGDDSGWGMADEFAEDPALKNAVGVLGSHYPCGYLNQADSCSTTANARSSGKPLWASEMGSQDFNDGVVPYIRTLNRGYLDAGLTGFMNWPPVAAITANLPFADAGLMVARSPWSGAYRVGKNLWANAHYAQFAQPGWKYLNGSASGYLGGDRANGSFVSLKSATGGDYSTIYETSGASAAQTVDVTVSGGLNTGAVHVWSTDMGSSDSADWFVRQADVTPSGGAYTLTLQPNHIYSVTTTTGQGKGAAIGPAASSMALPYSDDFEGYPLRQQPHYFEDMQGSYEVRACAAGRSDQCLQQVTPQRPINWQGDSDAYTLMGDPDWTDYTVSVDVDIQQSGTVTLLGRANTQGQPQSSQAAYQLRIADDGAWSIVRNSTGGVLTTLTSGRRPAFGTNNWHTLRLGFTGNQITAAADDVALATVTDTAYTTGMAGLGVVGYQTDLFDNLRITPNPAGNLGGIIKGQQSGLCVDVPDVSQSNGTAVNLWDCNGGGNQQWTLTPAKLLQVYGDKCLETAGGGTVDGTVVQINDCTGGQTQQWTVNSDGSVVNIGSGTCLDAFGRGVTNGTALVVWTCNGGPNQHFTRGDTAGYLRGQDSGRCVDVPALSHTNGTAVDLWDCIGGANETWTSTATNQLKVYDTKCLEAAGTAGGSAVHITDCTGQSNQQWRVRSDGAVVNVASGACLDASGKGTSNGTPVIIWACTGDANQVWTRN